MTNKPAALPALLIDLLLFIAPALLFNWLYVVRFQGAMSGAWLNVYLVCLLWIALIALRFLLACWLSPRRLALIGGVLMGSVWFSLVIFYSLGIIGLGSWGKVPTYQIIKVYVSQLGVIVDALNISLYFIAFVLVTSIAVLIILYRLVWKKILCLTIFNRLTASLLFLSVVISSGILFWQTLYYADPAVQNEAFFEAFFPDLYAKKIQSLQLHSSKKMEIAEQIARKHYKKTIFIPRNVIVIVMDALRADHLSLYGYARKTTPFLDTLHQNRQLQTASPVRSACAESSCGLLALAKSKYPNHFTTNDFSLYEVLQRYGYRIHFLLSGDHTHFYNLKEVFKPYDTYSDGSSQSRQFSYTNDDRFLVNELKKLPDFTGTPTYIQFHLMSTHGLGLRIKPGFPFSPAKNYYNLFSVEAMKGGIAKQRSAINYYDNGLYQADGILADLFATLKTKGYLRNAIVIITGDHGELLGENGLYAHEKTISEPVLNIPLIIWSSKPDDSSIAVKNWPIMSQIDIAPTILHALQIAIPSTWQGVALQNTPENRDIIVTEGDDAGVYAAYHDIVYKLTLNRNQLVEEQWILEKNRLLLTTQIPPEVLKAMRIKLYQIDR